MHKAGVGVLPPKPIGRVVLVGSWPEAFVTRLQMAELEATGCAIRWLSKGEEWREAVAAFGPHVILLHATPPDEDAADLCRQIRSVSEAKLLIILDEDSVARRVRLLDTGADDVVRPKFSSDELIARVRCLLRRVIGPAPQVLRFEEFEFDTGTGVISRDGLPLVLGFEDRARAQFLLRQAWRIGEDEWRWLRSLPTIALRPRWDG